MTVESLSGTPPGSTTKRMGSRDHNLLGRLVVPAGLAYAAIAGAVFATSPSAGVGLAGVGLVTAMLAASQHRPLREVVLVGALLVSGLVDWPRSLHLGPFTGGGAVTLAAAVVLPLGWGMAPGWRTSAMPSSLKYLSAFLIWVALSLAYHPPSSAGIQNILVWIAFVGAAATTLVAVRARRSFAATALKALAASSVLACLLYAASVARGGLDSHAVIDPRGFALFALVAVACGLAWFRSGRRIGLLVALAATVLILLSLSRLALATALILWGVATLNPTSIRGKLRFLVAACLAALTLYGAVKYIKPLHDRFSYGQIVRINTGVPGFAHLDVNAEGRVQLWSTTWDSYLKSPIIGHGAGSADDLITRVYGQAAGHPHNDYLRLLDDYGAIGLMLWLIAFGSCVWTVGTNWTKSLRRGDPSGAPYHLAAMLALIGLALGMCTDNVMIYGDIMIPIGVLIGLSCGMAETPIAYDTVPTTIRENLPLSIRPTG